MPLILTLDQSTSATKAILFEAAGQVVDKAVREHRQIYPQPGWVEHDAEEIWENVLAVISELAQRHSDKISQIAGLSITNQRETILIFDRKTGRPLHNAIVWQCRRGDLICQKLQSENRTESVRQKTGLKIDTYFSASKLKWLIAEKPELAVKLNSGDALIGTIDTYLIYRLTRQRVFATDHTNASRTLLFDIQKLRWDEALCELFDVPIRALPEVRESAARFGETDADGLLPNAVPIIGVMGDSQASLFAQRCFATGTAKATFGTGTSVLLNIGHEFRLSERGAITALAWVQNGKPTYAFEGLINFSAATLEWLKNQLGLIHDINEVEALATVVPDNGGVYLVPAFAGLSAPYWSPEARAAIVGLTAHTRREHIIRAALESIAYQIRDVLEMMRSESEVQLQSLHADGGPTRNQFLMQFTADIIRADLLVSIVPDSSAWGSAMNALAYFGIPDPSTTTKFRNVRKFNPRMDEANAKRLHEGWKFAVQRVL